MGSGGLRTEASHRQDTHHDEGHEHQELYGHEWQLLLGEREGVQEGGLPENRAP